LPRLKERFIVDSRGKRVGVIVEVQEYEHLTRALEELESIQAYDRAKESGDEAIPFEQAVEEIERRRK
jgi:PHD/YefM family antitoxin component YafN of YafNO toxin-antitoxin module